MLRQITARLVWTPELKLKLANDHFSFRGSDNAATTLAQAALDPKAFARLTDAILDSIYVSLEEGLDEAQGLIERMKKRDYYRQIGRSMQISPLPQCHYCAAAAGCGDVASAVELLLTKELIDEQGVFIH